MYERKKYSLLKNGVWYVKRIKSASPDLYRWMTVGTIVTVFLTIVTVSIPTVLVSQLTSKPELIILISVILGMLFLLALLNYIDGYIEAQLFPKMLNVRSIIGNEITEKALTTDYQYLEDQEFRVLQDLANTNGANNNQSGGEAFVRYSYKLLQNCVSLIILSITISLIQPILILFVALSVVINFFALKYTRAFQMKHKEAWAKSKRRIDYLQRNAYAVENGKDIRLYQMNDWYNEHIDESIHAYMDGQKQKTTSEFLSDLFQIGTKIARNAFAYLYLIDGIMRGLINLTQFTLYFSIMNSITTQIQSLVENIHFILKANQDLNDVRTFIEIPEKTLRRTSSSPKFKVSDFQKLKIEFEDVSFKYPGSETFIIENLSFTIGAGEKIALVGHNGAGKTTIVKLLTGLLQPTTGRILVNTQDISTIPLEDYYQLIAPVFQETTIFAFDIGTNVANSTSYSHEKVWSKLSEVNLSNKIESFKDQLQTELTTYLKSDGVELSGGESQKLMLARALYKDAPLLILDEPTAALDAIAENELYEGYSHLTEGKTSLFISHRLASTRFCDRIIFLEHGKIKETGTHQSLIEFQGKYAEMYAIQSKYYQQEVIEDEK